MEIQKGFKQTEVGVIPIDWQITELGSIADITKLAGFEYSKYFNSYKDGGDIIVLRGTNITRNELDLSDVKTIPRSTSNNLQRSKLVKNDLVFAYVGTIGPIYLVRENNRFHLGPNTSKITLKKSYDPQFIFSYFKSWLIKKEIFENTSIGAQPSLSMSKIRKFKINLPPTKAEQTAIATALNDADALITQLEKFIAKKQAIKQGAMQELLKPKEGWEVKTLGKIADIRRGASPRPIKDPKWFSDSGRGWIRISDVTSSNVYLNSTTQYLSEDGARNSVAVNRGDLIMSICATIGIPIIINIPACIHDGFVLFKNYEKELDTFFLYFFLQVKTEILTGKGQPGTQKNLNTTIVGDIEIDYPDVDEQRKIGLILRDIDIEISGLEMKLDKLKMLKQGMMQNLLTGRIRLV